MSKDIADVLREATRTGATVRIVYHGGSHPGTERDITPVKVGETEVMARDPVTGAVKTYLLSRITSPDPCVSSSRHIEESPSAGAMEYAGIPVACAQYVADLEMLGWFVQTGKGEISLTGRFKNGNLKKTPSAGITYGSYFDDRPWYVFGPGLQKARSYSELSPALSTFLDQAWKHAPIPSLDRPASFGIVPKAFIMPVRKPVQQGRIETVSVRTGDDSTCIGGVAYGLFVGKHWIISGKTEEDEIKAAISEEHEHACVAVSGSRCFEIQITEEKKPEKRPDEAGPTLIISFGVEFPEKLLYMKEALLEWLRRHRNNIL
jgi:hypothetical protein